MSRLLLVALLAAGCQNAFHMLTVGAGDGGPPLTNGTTGGGISNPDLSGVTSDGGTTIIPGLIRIHAATPSFMTARFGSDGCKSTIVSGCTVLDCTPADMGASAHAPNAGTLLVNGAAVAISMMPLSDGTYAPFSYSKPLWTRTTTLAFTASGADVHAFSTQLDTPVAATINTPGLVGSLDVPRNSDFDLAWSGATVGRLAATFTVGVVSVTCDYAVGDGTATVPLAALMLLPTGNGSLDVEDTTTVTPVEAVVIQAETPALDPSGNPYQVPITVR